ncbi:hypothetical protein AIC33_000186 [Salmonella enterica subsp. enterica]|nr:hypothetical protein [Salmonella enterica subsp. enterica serovar Kottbus]EDT6741795.1 hypothetical protein [Salmonella enterica subsp. enterica serovar Glostrup]EEJ5142889.1 hypothetical protein [Salmonella enterica subsp. enterica serovar Hadar]
MELSSQLFQQQSWQSPSSLLFSFLSFDLLVVSASRFLHSHGENCFPEDFDHDDHDGIFCRYSVR